MSASIWKFISLGLIWVIIGLPAIGQTEDRIPATFVIVANTDTTSVSLSRARIANIFLKKERTWPDGTPATPFDWASRSNLFAELCKIIHHKRPQHILNYWKQQIFSGRNRPPIRVSSIRSMLEYIRKTPGSIGYLPADTELPTSVKTIHISSE